MDPEYRLRYEGILSFFQDVVATYLETENLAAFQIRPDGRMWIISEITARVTDRLPVWMEKVFVTISPTEVSSLKMYFDYSLANADGKVFADGSSCWSIMDIESGRPVRLSDFIRFVGENSIRHTKNLLPAVTDAAFEEQHRVTAYDLDFNYHLNNIRYVTMALASVPVDVVRHGAMSNLIIRFMRQCFADEILTCRYSSADFTDEVGCSIVNQEGQEVCRVGLNRHSFV